MKLFIAVLSAAMTLAAVTPRAEAMGTVTLGTVSLGAVTLTLASSHAATAAPAPAPLLQSCQAVIRAAGATHSATVEIPLAGLPCWYYMAAIQNMSTLVDQQGKHLLGVCAPSDTSLLQYVRIFARYAERHSGQHADNDAALALRALLDAFPCGARRGVL